MISGLRLGRFKAFGDAQHVPLRPITLVFGPNSAGKSSLIHALLLAHEALRTGDLDVRSTRLGGDSVDLGGFRRYVHRHDPSGCVEWGADIDLPSLQATLPEPLSREDRLSVDMSIGLTQRDTHPQVLRYTLTTGGRALFKALRSNDGSMRLNDFDPAHPVVKRIVEAILLSATTSDPAAEGDANVVAAAVNDVARRLLLSPGAFVPSGVLNRHAIDEGQQFPVSTGCRSDDLAAAVRYWLPDVLHEIVAAAHQTVAQALARTSYLGPLRSYPPRHATYTTDRDANWQAGGGFAWDELRQQTDLREKVNRWLDAPDRLQTPYRLEARRLVAQEANAAAVEEAIREAAGASPDTSEIARAVAARLAAGAHGDELTELVLLDRTSQTVVSHRDVGIGVSQVLPVLAAAYGSTGRLWAIEQPEIHLHPALQADLADVFVESALGPLMNRFILETHSEHLVLRLLRRIRERYEDEADPDRPPLTPEDVQVLYAKPTSHGTVLFPIPIAEDGDFAERWPDGFFPEREEELF